MPSRIPQSITIRVPMKGYLSVDHTSDATGLDPAVVISINGAAFANPSAGATVLTEIGNGWYYVDLSATDTGTQGPLVIRATHATMDNIEIVYQVVNANNLGALALPDAIPASNGGLVTTNGTKINQTADLTAGQMIDANVTSQDNIDFGALQKASITASVNLSALATAANLAIVDGIVDAIKLKTDTLGGAGAIAWAYTLTDSITGLPIDGAEVWVSTDSAGANIIASGTTDAYGVVNFTLDAGLIYVWRKKAGYNFSDPDSETVA